MEGLKGKQLGGYQIVEQLGVGGMATVYKAYQPKMDRYVALKILPRHLSDNIEFVERFSQEARVIAKLEHPHILPVHDFGEDAGYTYLAMRLVQGGSLAQLLRKHRRLELPKVNRIIRQVGEALDYAHQQGVIHRDFKPGNVLIDEFENCLLTDFGIAKLMEATSNLTATGGILGTPAYVSPEQGMGEAIDYRSDIYSLGVVLYQMVTGSVPYKADTPMGVIFKHVQAPLPLPRDKVPDLPESVERVILKALAKSPDERFNSAGAMILALDMAINAPRVQVSEVSEPVPDSDETEKAEQPVSPETELHPTEIPDAPTPQTKIKERIEPTAERRKAGALPYAIVGAIILIILAGAGWLYYSNFSTVEPILSISTNPPGANVYVDEGHVGVSPIEVQELLPGTHKIRISLNRYQDYNENLFVQKGKPRKIAEDLIPKPFGDLKLDSNPPGAAIFIDGQKMGVTPADLKNLPKGTSKIRLQKEGFDPWEGVAQIVPLKTAKVSADLISIYGGIDVASKPSGAEVWIDGKLTGKTPLVKEKVRKGQLKIELKLDGFDDWSQSVVAKSKETAKVNVTLKTIYGSLNVASKPSGAEVYVDSNAVGKTPLKLDRVKNGSHKVLIKKDGFDDWSGEVGIKPEELSSIQANLITVFGSLNIISKPSGAEVYIDGKNAGKTPLVIDKVKKGNRKIEIKNQGFDTWSETAEVLAEETLKIKADLAESFGSLKVVSEPDGAEVLIDGRQKGKTPLALDKLKKGTFKIEIRKACFAPGTKSVSIAGGKESEVRFNLESVCGGLAVESTPAGAEWYLDGKRMGVTPATVADIQKGEHRVKLVKEDHDEWSRTVTVQAGKSEKVRAELFISVIRDGHYIQFPSGVVRDTQTNLEWYAGPAKGTGWNEAKRWAENLTVAGGGWRMPSQKELKSLYQKGVGSWNMTKLLKINWWWVWSGETRDSSSGWLFTFKTGGLEGWLNRTNSNYGPRGVAVRSISKSSGLKIKPQKDEPQKPDPGKSAIESRYTKYSNGVVLDKQTGLEWFAGPDTSTKWSDANQWVKSLKVAGGGWRMPTRSELKNLYQEGVGSRHMTPLLKMTGLWVWSDEKYGESGAWYISFRTGTEDWRFMRNSGNFRGFAVRSTKSPKQRANANVKKAQASESDEIKKGERFVKHPNGVVYDTKTNLEWYAGPDQSTSWGMAKDWVENLKVAGGGWRMPTRKELMSLYQHGVGSRNMTPLLETTGWWVWAGDKRSSSEYWNFGYSGSGIFFLRASYTRGFAVRSRK